MVTVRSSWQQRRALSSNAVPSSLVITTGVSIDAHQLSRNYWACTDSVSLSLTVQLQDYPYGILKVLGSLWV